MRPIQFTIWHSMVAALIVGLILGLVRESSRDDYLHVRVSQMDERIEYWHTVERTNDKSLLRHEIEIRRMHERLSYQDGFMNVYYAQTPHEQRIAFLVFAINLAEMWQLKWLYAVLHRVFWRLAV